MIRCLMVTCAGLLLVCATGCKRQDISALEAQERTSSLNKKAREAELSGNTKEAIRLYREILVSEPRSFSAHFQLAAMLQDVEQNYIDAIYHYNQYLAFRPDSEKSTLAQERIRIAEQLLAPQILRRVGDSVQGLTQAHLLKETDRLNQSITKLEGEKSVLLEENETLKKKVAREAADAERMRVLLRKIRGTDAESVDATPLSRREVPESSVTRSDMRSLKDQSKSAAADTATRRADVRALREEAAVISGAKPSKVQESTPADETLKKVQARVAAEQTATKRGADIPAILAPLPSTQPATSAGQASKSTSATPEKRTYVVQPGDTLFRVSEKFYGDATHWKKLRDANRTTIDPDGRIRAGQVIVVP